MALNIRSMAPVIGFTFGFCLLATLTQVTLAKDELYIDVLSFNSSTVELVCRYEGDKTEIFFKVYKKKYACFYQKSTCEYYPQPECDFQCKETGNKNMVLFSVNLNGSCQEQVVVRCFVRTSAPGQDLEMDTFLILPAQSDAPEITIHKDQPVELSLEPVPISCTVSNRCNHTPLEISGIHMSSLHILHKNQGSRYNTTAETTAIFNEAGNYTINCREAGNQGNFSSNITVEVIHPDEDPRQTVKGTHALIAGSILSAVILILTFLLCVFGLLLYKARKRNRWYDKLAKEDITNEKSGETRSEDKRNDRLLWNHTRHFCKKGTFHQDDLDKLKGLIRAGANPCATYRETNALTIFLKAYNFHQPDSFSPSALSFFNEVLQQGQLAIVKRSTLNDIIKSIPFTILKSEANLHSFEQVIVKICLKIIETNSAVCNHMDSKLKTPIQNLAERLGPGDIWQKLFKETDNLLDLMPELMNNTNGIIPDNNKDSVTQYSWLSWWKETMTPKDVTAERKITSMLELFYNKQKKHTAVHGLEHFRQIQKVENVLKLQSSVCGFWVKDDEAVGKQISKITETGLDAVGTVEETEIENMSFFQDNKNYLCYFSVISSESLKNHNFCVHLMSVLRRLAFGTLHNKSTFALVVVDKDAASLLDDAQDKTIHWPIDLQAIPRVDACSPLGDGILNQIVSKLQGPPQNPGVSPFVGNVGVGLAWHIFQCFFAFMLPGITEKIAKSEAYKKYAGKMSKHFIFIIPGSYEIALEMEKNGIPRSKEIGDLDEGIKIERDGYYPYDLKEVVEEITNSQGICFYCCNRYFVVHERLKYMLESGELTEDQVKKEYSLYADTMKSILCDPIYHNHALVLNCKDYSTLPDDLCDLITKQNKQTPLRIDTNPRNQVARVAEGLAWDYYHFYVKEFAPGLEKAMKDTKFYHQKEMPAKYFVLLPYLSVIYTNLEDAEKERIKFTESLKWSKYIRRIYKISNDLETYYACARYSEDIQVLHEMETGEIAALTPMQRAAELRIYYEVLNYLLTRPSAPECCRIFKLVYYDDDKHSGRKVSEVLMDEIKESLQEVQGGGS